MSTFICKDTVQVTQRSQEKSLTVLLVVEKQSAFYWTCWKAKSKDHHHITSNWFSGANKQSLNFEQKCSLFRNLNLKYQLCNTGSSDRILYVSRKTQHWECIYQYELYIQDVKYCFWGFCFLNFVAQISRNYIELEEKKESSLVMQQFLERFICL